MAVGVGILVVFPIGNTKEGGKSPSGRRSGVRAAGAGAAGSWLRGAASAGECKNSRFKNSANLQGLFMWHLGLRSAELVNSLPPAQWKVSLCQTVIFCVQRVRTA